MPRSSAACLQMRRHNEVCSALQVLLSACALQCAALHVHGPGTTHLYRWQKSQIMQSVGCSSLGALNSERGRGLSCGSADAAPVAAGRSFRAASE